MRRFICAMGAVVALAILLVVMMVTRERRFADPTFGTPASVARTCGTVAVIGDSWAAYQLMDEPLRQRGFQVLSHGHNGAKSRAVYDELRQNRAILDNPSVCNAVVIAGTNDTAGHVGADYYAYHMALIAKLLNSYGITPLLVSAPQWNSAYSEPAGLSSLKHTLFRFVYDGGTRDVVPKYRAMLRERLQREHITADVLEFGANYPADYRDNFHLNQQGRSKLADRIAARLRPVQQSPAATAGN